MRGSPIALVGLAIGCAPPETGVVATQAPIRAHLVVHVDPLPRIHPEKCADSRLVHCGALDGRAWRRRTQNLAWLADRWWDTGRTLDLQLGPEVAMAWAGEATVSASLAESLTSAEVDEVAARGRSLVAAMVDQEVASLGLHMHTVLPDSGGTWGELALPGLADPCAASSAAPVSEISPDVVEELVHWGSAAVDPLALTVGGTVGSFTSHVPRSLAAKITAVRDPDGLDPDVDRTFPSTFQPQSLSSAYAECFQQEVDHPPLEVYPAHDVLALAPGQGPPVIPGNRVVGSMAPHLGAPVDGAAQAAERRLVQLLLNWRVAGLRGDADRPWAFTFHEHLFDLHSGTVAQSAPRDRQRDAARGQKFRSDLEILASAIDALARREAWQGVVSDGGAVIEWALPETLTADGSAFAYTADDGAPISGMDTDHYPYLPLVAERLSQSHLRCTVMDRATDIFVFDRCSAGWAWGEIGLGYHCVDGQPPEEVTVLVGPAQRCMRTELDGLRAAPVTGTAMDEPERCGSGIVVPLEGLIVEPRAGTSWMGDRCRGNTVGLLEG